MYEEHVEKGDDIEKQDENPEGQPSAGNQDEEVIAFVGRGVEFKGVIT